MYVVIGANGYIGSYIIKNVLEYTEDDVLALGRTIETSSNNNRVINMKCDISSEEDVELLSKYISNKKNIKIVYLAAYHHPDEVKKNPRMAWNINITSLSAVINKLENVKCLFYLSTEMVYGAGTFEHKFNEEDELAPVNLYGIHKKIAEEIVLGYGYNVVRFPFVIGPSLLPNRKHFYDVIVETVKKGDCIEMFTDAYKSALDFDTATNLVVQLIEKYNKDMPKVINVAGDDVLSKYDIGIEIAKKNALDIDKIIPIHMNEDNKIFKETRAACTLLDNSLLKRVLGISTIKMKF